VIASRKATGGYILHRLDKLLQTTIAAMHGLIGFMDDKEVAHLLREKKAFGKLKFPQWWTGDEDPLLFTRWVFDVSLSQMEGLQKDSHAPRAAGRPKAHRSDF
jgi:hypothetical protein